MYERWFIWIFRVFLLIHPCSSLTKTSTRISIKEETRPGLELANLKNILSETLRYQIQGKFKLIAPQEVVSNRPSSQQITGSWLSIDRGSGVLGLSKRIDREQLCGESTKCIIRFKVFVSQSHMMVVDAEIEDINDNAPTFPVSKLVLNVSENPLVDREVNLDAYQATDRDIGENARLRYNTSYSRYVKIRHYFDDNNSSRLVLQLKRNLDYEVDKIVRFAVGVNDAGNPSLGDSMQVAIRVVDDNDHSPIFEKDKYGVNVTEGFFSEDEIIRVNADDADSGLYGTVTYRLSFTNPEVVFENFKLNDSTGALFLRRPLDREMYSSFRISIEASDSAPSNPKTKEAFVDVSVQDKNDNVPRLEIGYIAPHNGSRVFLPESPTDESTVSYVADISAKDDDIGANGEVEITLSDRGCSSIRGKRPYFNLTSDKLLRSVAPFDRETCGNYRVVLKACDKGEPSLCTSKTIHISILDVNEYAPVFTDASKEFEVDEDAAVRHVAATVKARDDDSVNSPALMMTEDERIVPSKNGEVTYAIEKGGGGHFAIGKRDGRIRIKSALDREEVQSWKLTVSATDGGSPPRVTTTDVTIIVNDVNDNAPRFVNPTANGSMLYAYLSQGDRISTIKAIDTDSGNNGEIAFSISNARLAAADGTQQAYYDYRKLFMINQMSGELKLNISAENVTEKTGEYQLEIMAEDKGKSPLRSRLLVKVLVSLYSSDVKGNSPPHLRKSSIFKDPYFMSILLGGVAFLLIVFAVLAFVRCRRIKEQNDRDLKAADSKQSEELIDSKFEYQDNNLPYDIFRPHSCHSADAVQSEQNTTKGDTIPTTVEDQTKALCPQQSDSDSGRGDSDLDGGCAGQSNATVPPPKSVPDLQEQDAKAQMYLAKVEATNRKCGEQCRKYGHGDACWMPDTEETVTSARPDANATMSHPSSNGHDPRHQLPTTHDGRSRHLRRAASYGHYSSHAVNLSDIDAYSLPRKLLPDRPHSNPCLQYSRPHASSPAPITEYDIPSTCHASAYATNTAPMLQRSLSLRDDRTIRKLPRSHLETVYETEDMLPTTSASGYAPLLTKQNRVCSPYPTISHSPQDGQNLFYRYHSSTPATSAVYPVVSVNPNSNMGLDDVQSKISKFEYML